MGSNGKATTMAAFFDGKSRMLRKHLLPPIAASYNRTANLSIVARAECRMNSKLRDAYAIDFEGLLRSSERRQSTPDSIHSYSTPPEDDNDDEGDNDNESCSVDESC